LTRFLDANRYPPPDQVRGHASLENALKRNGKEKGRPVSRAAFPVLRQLHIDGRFQDLNTGGLSPGHILIGSRC
jgi:hypothetical protein